MQQITLDANNTQFVDEFDWLQVIQFNAPARIRLDGSDFDLIGLQFFAKQQNPATCEIDHYERVEFTGTGSIVALVGKVGETGGIAPDAGRQGDTLSGLTTGVHGVDLGANGTITSPGLDVSKYKELYISAINAGTSISAFLRWSLTGAGLFLESGNIGGAVSFQQPTFLTGNKIQIYLPFLAIRWVQGPAGGVNQAYAKGFRT